MSDDEANIFARELIRLVAISLRDLNNGKPIPKRWRDELNDELGQAVKRGIKPNRIVTEREQRWARQMLAQRWAIERGESAVKMTAFAQMLARQEASATQIFTAQSVFKAESKWRYLSLSEEAWQRLMRDDTAREASDPARNAALPAHLKTERRPVLGMQAPPSAYSYKDRVSAIKHWVHDAWRLHIGWPPPALLNIEEASRRKLLPKNSLGRNRTGKRF